jgi:uncharacterized protein (DUF362 family)
MIPRAELTRRHFLKAAIVSSAAAAATRWGMHPAMAAAAEPAPSPTAVPAAAPSARPSRVALTTGEDRANIAFQGLKSFEKEIAAAIGDKRVIVKPNNVEIGIPLACTAAENLEGILEFLKSIGKKNIVIAESSAGNTMQGFSNLGYTKLSEKYGVPLMDLDTQPSEILPCFSENDLRAHPVRISSVILDPNSFVISATKLKTHNLAVATLSLKNIVLGAPVKTGGRSDKSIVHGGGSRGINFNLANLAFRLHPHLAVIDGYQGMEGMGPSRGTPVEHRVCVTSLDWLAADRVGLELMGIDPAKIGYMTYCSQFKMGETDLARIEIVGAELKDHVRTYQLAPNIDQQLEWMQPYSRPGGQPGNRRGGPPAGTRTS